jgi:hypothetical protein
MIGVTRLILERITREIPALAATWNEGKEHITWKPAYT